jgi:peroxiredoxin
LHKEFSGKDATIVALSPQDITFRAQMVDSHNLSFDILGDPGNEFASRLGLRFTLPDELIPIYKSFGIDLPACNGDDSWSLPIPARILISATGEILDVNADPDYTVRPEPLDTLTLLG